MPKGTVKWFNNAKGYGFIIEDGHSEDLFAHFSSIQMEGYKTLKAGQTVYFEKQAGDKGFHAVNIKTEQVLDQAPTNEIDHDEFISVEEPNLNRAPASTSTEASATEKQDKTATA